jgi:dTDP-4-dehydrorhamnose reductase
MNLLVTGGGGQLGQELSRRSQRVIALDRQSLDITEAAAVERAIAQYQPDLVINAAAYTAVDRAESEPEAAFRINRDGPACLALACQRAGIPLFHVSTDYVFDGTQQGPYRETDPVAPLGVYGRSKEAGEATVRASLERHLILRVSWVFAGHGHNFVRTMLRLAADRPALGVVADQWGCPTYAGHIAEVLLALADRYQQQGSLAWGTYHYADTPATSWYGFAAAIFATAQRLGLSQVPQLSPITTADYPTLAQRPANSQLDCMKLQDTFGLSRFAWQAGLEAALLELMALPVA